jgi:hypothetical protein
VEAKDSWKAQHTFFTFWNVLKDQGADINAIARSVLAFMSSFCKQIVSDLLSSINVKGI